MEFTGEYRIPATREAVWAALNDAEVLRACIPGCQSLDKTSDTEYTAKVRTRIGPMTAVFTGRITLSDIDPPNGYRIDGEGQGGVAGFAKGGARVSLDSENGGTRLAYTADAQIGGKMAQLGSRLIDATARKMADAFFAAFSESLGGAVAAEEAPPIEPARRGLAPLIWIAGLIVLVALILYIFAG
ncbi:MAG: SRPBCC family protein, partial [Alphaproteobacteria bacterium]